MTPHPKFVALGRSPRGFTTIELLVALSITGVLSGIAYPSFSAQIDKSRRADAFAAVTATQMAEEQWRANQPSYGSLAQIGAAALSPGGRYGVQVGGPGAHAYAIVVTAQGLQARDADCRVLRLDVSGGNETRRSGPDASVANAPALNRRCWSL
jgi:type IV pilus assembly protein PilE